MTENMTIPKIILKKKQVPVVLEFCLDEAIEIGIKQQIYPDTDYEVELKLKDMKTAILVGMFLRENKFEMEGIDAQRYKKLAPKKEEKPVENSKPEPTRLIKEPVSNNNLLAGIEPQHENGKMDDNSMKKDESKQDSFLL